MSVQHAVLAFALVEKERQRRGDRAFAGGRDQTGEPGAANGRPDALDVVFAGGMYMVSPVSIWR
jgi:hypothetical protein